MKNLETIAHYIESAMQGEPPQSFKDHSASALVRTIATLTPQELFQIGSMTVQIILARQLASAHAEREIQILRDNAQRLC